AITVAEQHSQRVGELDRRRQIKDAVAVEVSGHQGGRADWRSRTERRLKSAVPLAEQNDYFVGVIGVHRQVQLPIAVEVANDHVIAGLNARVLHLRLKSAIAVA